MTTVDENIDALSLAIMFHHTYERLAPSVGYDTRAETRIFDPESPNGKLMLAVCTELLPKLHRPAPPAQPQQVPVPVAHSRPLADVVAGHEADPAKAAALDEARASLQERTERELFEAWRDTQGEHGRWWHHVDPDAAAWASWQAAKAPC